MRKAGARSQYERAGRSQVPIFSLASMYPVEGFIEPAEDIKMQSGDALWKR
jgi:hypothetical protein